MNNNREVYLAGPIAGLSYSGATDWREYVKRELQPALINGLSPMRCKEYLAGVAEFTADGDKYRALSVLSSNKGIVARDRFDATRCAVLFVNLLGAKTVSIGTVMEIAWADACRTPIVLVMEVSGNPHEHGMLTEVSGFRVETLDEGIAIVKAILK